jgi:alkylhydroperoxidase family enzyme
VACKIARKNPDVTEEDVACLSSDDARFNPRERLALKFTELFATDHFAIDDAFFVELGKLFTKAEIIELGMSVSAALGGGRLAHVLRAYDNDEQPPVLRYEGEFAPETEKAKSAA